LKSGRFWVPFAVSPVKKPAPAINSSVVYGGLRMQIWRGGFGRCIPPMRFGARIAHDAQQII
jgi:hypothetical protein